MSNAVAAASIRSKPTVATVEPRSTLPMPTTVHHRPECPMREVLDRVADRWTTLIMGMLAETACRYSEISHAAADMNPRVLSRTLRAMERDGLISRTVLGTKPLVVSYSLTDLGRSLEALIAPLRVWSEGNIDDILGARRRFDDARADETPVR